MGEAGMKTEPAPRSDPPTVPSPLFTLTTARAPPVPAHAALPILGPSDPSGLAQGPPEASGGHGSDPRAQVQEAAGTTAVMETGLTFDSMVSSISELVQNRRDVEHALSICGNDPNRAANLLIDKEPRTSVEESSPDVHSGVSGAEGQTSVGTERWPQ